MTDEVDRMQQGAAACSSNRGARHGRSTTMFINARTAALALSLALCGAAGTAHAYDAFGGSDNETLIRQSAASAPSTAVQKPDYRFMVGTNPWTGDRDALIRDAASSGLGKQIVASKAR